MNKTIKEKTVSLPISIREAIKKLDSSEVESLVVLLNSKVEGVFTMGDFRRAVLKGLDINSDLTNIINRDFVYLTEQYTNEQLYSIFKNKLIVDVPVVNSEGELIDIVNINQIDGLESDCQQSISSNKVVIMAGGKGTRMDPFTRILPKPLVPLGNRPAIQVIMDEFNNHAATDFYLSIHDKAQMIVAYFHEHKLPYNISYIEEERPMGTAGALLKLKGLTKESFFVSNCDVIIYANYNSILDFHIKGEYDLTIVASLKHFQIPYGICELNEDGQLHNIVEKPIHDYLANTGLYVVEPEMLDLISEDTYFDMPDLISLGMETGKRIGVYPIPEKSWIDIGQWKEYTNYIEELY